MDAEGLKRDRLHADGWDASMPIIDADEHAKKQSAAVPMNVLTMEGRSIRTSAKIDSEIDQARLIPRRRSKLMWVRCRWKEEDDRWDRSKKKKTDAAVTSVG